MPCADDDYGKSYYYRGIQDNNYVVFANMCWRIVRIDGNDNIKLVLFNNNSASCTTTNETAAFSNTGIVFAYLSGSGYEGNYGLGYMRGVKSKNYDENHENKNESDILKDLETWYKSKIYITTNNDSSIRYTDYLADVVWCNDKSITTSISDYPYGIVDYGTNYSNPSFKCPDASGTDKNISRFTAGKSVDSKGNGALTIDGFEYKIGLLTANEVAFAGGTSATSSSYLNQNANGKRWWTLSPDGYYGGYETPNAHMYCVYNGSGITQCHPNESQAVRPSVALKSTVKYILNGTGEPGSNTNPYVITSY